MYIHTYMHACIHTYLDAYSQTDRHTYLNVMFGGWGVQVRPLSSLAMSAEHWLMNRSLSGPEANILELLTAAVIVGLIGASCLGDSRDPQDPTQNTIGAC